MKIILPLALLLSAATPAMAQDAPASVHVGYSDINLASPAGVAELDRRIARAVTLACPDSKGRQLIEVQAVHACRTIALRSVVDQRQHALATRTGTLTIASTR